MSTKNLYNQEAIEKITEMATDIDFCMMVTNLDEAPLHAIPMSTKKVDDHGAIWFLSKDTSNHNQDIEKDKRIQLLYNDISDMEFLSVYGDAYIENDRELIKELYSKVDDAWFDDENDPSITAIKVVPSESYYWDNKNGKMVTMFKMAAAAVTGNKQDVSVQGKLKT